MKENLHFFGTTKAAKGLIIDPKTKYDRTFTQMRFEYLEKYAINKDILDLCCGSGSYLIPVLHKIKTAIALDYSKAMLDCLKTEIIEFGLSASLILADASRVPIQNNAVDFVFSYCSLYYIKPIFETLKEIHRVLRPGGRAVLEMGNSFSLNIIVVAVQHLFAGWAKMNTCSVKKTKEFIQDAGFVILEHRSFQLLPMYGAPIPLFFLLPLLHPAWKKVMGISIQGKMIDEWISSSRLFTDISFRHIWVVQKRCTDDK